MKTKRILVQLILIAAAAFSVTAQAREPQKPSCRNPEAQALIDQAWAGLDQEMNLKMIDQAIALEEKAVAADPKNADLLAELADEYWQRGDLMPKRNDAEFDARNVYFQKGLANAGKSMAIKETAAGHYWTATNLAATDENAGKLKQLSIFLELSRHMDWIDLNAKGYKYGATARFWSEVSTRVPGIVIKAVGKNPDEYYQKLEDAIKIQPGFLQNYRYKAKFLYHQGKKEEAFKTLDQMLKMDPNAFAPEKSYNKFDQGRAREMWKEWTGKDYPAR
jgi:tetratricopeptide (TPR) repeat protein